LANEILNAAIHGYNAEIRVVENNLGGQYNINANGKIWASAKTIKIIEYRDVIQKLISNGYIEYSRKNTYRVTKSGLDYAANCRI
jgi:predicted transcriptional regulator